MKMDMKDFLYNLAVSGGSSGGGSGGSGMIDVPTGYKLVETTRKQTLATVSGIKINYNFASVIDITTANTINVNDSICLHASYASSTSSASLGDVWVWGTVSSKSGTASAYRTVNISVVGFIVKPAYNQSKSVSSNSNVNTVGYTSIAVNIPEAYINLTEQTFLQLPEQPGVVSFNSSDTPELQSKAVVLGKYQGKSYVVSGRVDGVNQGMISIFVETILTLSGEGYKYLTGKTFDTEPSAGAYVNIMSTNAVDVAVNDMVVVVGTSRSNKQYVATGTVQGVMSGGTQFGLSVSDFYEIASGGGGGSTGTVIIENMQFDYRPPTGSPLHIYADFSSYLDSVSDGDNVYLQGTIQGEPNPAIIYGAVERITDYDISVTVDKLYVS